jgi:hypothetical protein
MNQNNFNKQSLNIRKEFVWAPFKNLKCISNPD